MKEKIVTVGIDLGTSTTQMVLSELTVENFASAFSVPRISISEKQVIYRSEIIFTPLLNATEIDGEAVKAFVAKEYRQAGISKEDLQMGAVIITGETARKQNASNVLAALSGFAGDFVVATAGPDLESIIAGKGAGTHLLSKTHKGCFVNLDIGGGTTNLAAFKEGEVTDTACFDIGGRLIKVDPVSRQVTYLAPKIKELIAALALPLTVGAKTSLAELDQIVEVLVQVLENSVGLGTKSQFYDLFITHHDLKPGPVAAITFSGGVADCLQTELPAEPFRYGDIGLLLGHKLRCSQLFSEKEVFQSQETIRATVVGAGSHTAEVSGSTIAYTENILPVKNVPILKLAATDEQQSAAGLADRIKEKLNWYVLEGELSQVVLALNGLGNPSFADIQRYGQGIASGLAALQQEGLPLLVIVKEDMAKALGHSLFAALPRGYPFVCLDTVAVENGDYIDIGKPIADGAVLPVIVKTLVFE